MLKLIERSLREFRAAAAKVLFFEFLYMLITSAIIIPIITYVFNRILRVIGSGSLLNGEVYRLGLSYEGMIGLFLIGFVASFAVLIELFVLIALVQQRYFGKDIAIVDAFATALRKTPRLIGFGIFQLLFLLVLLIPFIDSPMSASFYALFNVPIFLNHRVLGASYTLTFVYVLLLIGALYTLLRWIFVLHFILLEDMPIRRAIRSSLALTKGHRLQLFFWLLVFNIVVLAAGSSALSALSYLPAWLNLDVLALVSQPYSLTLSTLLTYLLALLLLPINMFVLTRLFYSFGRTDGRKAQDRLKVNRSRLGRLELRVSRWLKGLQRKKALYIAVAALYIALTAIVGFRASDSLVYAKWNVLIAAHRADSPDLPENSLPALVAAIEKDVQVAELDIQLTKDGVAVLSHDSDLRRMAGVSSRVVDLTYAELEQLSIGLDPEGNTVRIPSLAEVLATAKGHIKLLLDLKPYGTSDELAEEVVRLVKEAEIEQDVRIQSFDAASLSRIREIDPELKIGRILYFALGDLTALDVDFYTIEQVMLTEAFVNRAHKAGREVWVWTVNEKRDMREVLKFEIDGLITDYPEKAQSLVDVNVELWADQP
ncbi:glycerophosphodiester phosphodiesterase [Cohnella fermenti]|uniref:Glycerophosphodiester phosphodiesterase n=1 Tax=Cohnella fermenti TaxID=2565925 RepID=A0A4S4BTQ2_9BACL|nr:glycerophosphodiester phosphodiesterase [Cohnella fermenti]THF76244.1 glycerophosphodiester phosphodiesterase [Cohnella fermenti]